MGKFSEKNTYGAYCIGWQLGNCYRHLISIFYFAETTTLIVLCAEATRLTYLNGLTNATLVVLEII